MRLLIFLASWSTFSPSRQRSWLFTNKRREAEEIRTHAATGGAGLRERESGSTPRQHRQSQHSRERKKDGKGETYTRL